MKQRVPANVLLLFGVLTWLEADRSYANTFTWNGSISTDWFNSTNWIPHGVPASTDTINFANGTTINLTSPITIAGSFNWISGTFSGKPVTVSSGGVLNISGSATLDNVLTNAGTVDLMSNAIVYVYNNNSSVFGGVYNLASGLWDIQTNATIYSGGYGFEFFNNSGTFRKSGGSGYATIYVPFSNNGLVTNLLGTVSFNSGGALTGTYGTAAGATTYFASGNFTMGAPPAITGPGLCEFQGTTLTLAQNWPTNLVLSSGNVFLTAAFQGGTITNLTLNGSVLAGTNKVTGILNAVSGTAGGPLTITGGGVMKISGSFSLNNVLTNAGTVDLISNATVYVYNNNSSVFGGVYNLAGGLWDIQTNATIYSGGYGFEFFNNAGTFRNSGPSGSATIYVPFTNSGLVTNLLGIISFNGGGTLAGSYGTAAGATTEFTSGNFTIGTPPVINGLGLCEFLGSTLTLTQTVPSNLVLAAGNVILGSAFQSGTITNLTLNGAVLTGTNKVTGTLNWLSGSLNGPLTVANGAVLTISGSFSLNNALTNAGTVDLISNAVVYVYNNNSSVFGGVYNLAGGLWDFQTNATIYSGGYGFEFFSNAGTFRKSGGSGYATIYVPFTNSGLVTNLLGIVSFNGGGTLAGSYGTAAGATTEFTSGNFTMGTPPIINGLGQCEFLGSTLTLTQTVPSNLVLAAGNMILGSAFQSGAITNLTLNGAVLTGTNKVTGTLNWLSGSLNGPLTVANGAVLTISGSFSLNNVLTNAGTVDLISNAVVYVYNNNSSVFGGVYNLAGGLWDIQTNATIYSGGYGFEFFNNAGTFRKSGGSGYATVYVPFTNTGTLDVLMGILSYSGSFTTIGGTLAFGVSSLANYGQINVTGAATLNGTASVSWLGGFMPAVGNSFALLSYGSHSGTFATITLPAGSAATPTYGATIFSLTITNATTQTNAPVFLNIRLISSNTVVVSWPSSATNYSLQTNAALSSAGWGNVTSGINTVSTNDVLTNTVNGKSDFFRLRSP